MGRGRLERFQGPDEAEGASTVVLICHLDETIAQTRYPSLIHVE